MMWVMETRDLEWFVALAETCHVTNTADKLNITQPTLSRAVARLEKQFGAPLFERTGKRMQLSRHGEVLIAHSLRALDELNHAQRRIDSMVDPLRGVVSLGFVTSFGSWLIPQLVEGYHREAPATDFLLEGGPADHILDLVRRGTIDVAIMSPEPNDPSLTWETIAEEPLLATLPSTHAFANQASISLEELSTCDLLGLRSNFGLRQISDRLFATVEMTPHLKIEATEVHTLWGLVAAGAGAAILPKAAQDLARPGTVQIPISGVSAVRRAGVVSIAKKRQTPPVASFLRHLHELGKTDTLKVRQ